MTQKKNNSILFWKSLETGFSSHSGLIPKKIAQKQKEKYNLKWPLIPHQFVKLTKEEIKQLKNGSVSVESFNPFSTRTLK